MKNIIEEMQSAGFLYQKKTPIEIIKDNYIYLKDDTDDDIVRLDWVMEKFNEYTLKNKRTIEDANKTSPIYKYFDLYGIQKITSNYDKNLFYSRILYDFQKQDAINSWDYKLLHRSVTVNYDDNANNFIKKWAKTYRLSYTLQRENFNADCELVNDVPKIKSHIPWAENTEDNSIHNYSIKEWNDDIEQSIIEYRKKLEEMITDNVTTNKTHSYYLCDSNKYVFIVRDDYYNTTYNVDKIDLGGRLDKYRDPNSGDLVSINKKHSEKISRFDFIDQLLDYFKQRAIKFKLTK